MKIAYFLDDTQVIGGTATLLLQQAALMSEIHDVIVVIPINQEKKYNQEYVRRCEKYKFSYCTIPYSTTSNFTNIDFLNIMECVECIEEFVHREKITFLHSVQLNIAVEYVARKLEIPHLMNIYQLRKEEFECCPGNICAHYHLCDSEMYRNQWSMNLGTYSKCIRPIALLDKIQKKNYAKKSLEILILGSVFARKNQLTAIKAIEKYVGFDKVRLHIAGSLKNAYAEQCTTYVKEHKLEQGVIFYGFVKDIIPLLENCDCLLCASTDESFPSSIVEALSYDLTIISTPVAGVPEVFVNKINGFISKDFSEKSIGDSVKECIQYYQTGEINTIHDRAESTWKNQFGRLVVKNQLRDFYQFIVENPCSNDLEPYRKVKEETEAVRELFDDISIIDEEWIQKKYMYYSVMAKKIKRGKACIWGAGKLGKIALDILNKICPDLEVSFFIDTYREGDYCGLPVLKPEMIDWDENFVYILGFMRGKEDVICYLENQGLILNKQIWICP